MRREARSAPLAVSFGDLRRGSSPLRRRGDSVSEESGDTPPRAVKQPRERRPSPPRHRAGVMVLPRGALSPPLSFPPHGGRVRVRVGVGRLPRGSVRLEHPPVSLHSYDAHERRPREFVRYGFPYVRERFPHAVFDSIAHFSRWHVAFAHASHEFERDSPERDSSLRRERHVERFDEVHGEHPRRPRADAQRLAHRVDIDARPRAAGELALLRVRDTAGELDHFEAALQIALGIVDDLAVLAGKQLGQLLHVVFQQLLELEHHPRAALGIGGGPGRVHLPGRVHGLLQQCGIAKGHFGLHFAGRRIPHLVLAASTC